MKIQMVIGLIALSVNTVLAGTYQLVPNEGGYNAFVAMTNLTSWSTDGKNTGTPPTAWEGNVFCVRGSKSLNTRLSSETPNEDCVFLGARLESGSSSASTGRIRQFTYGTAKTSWDNWGQNEGLYLYRGYYRTAVADATSHIYGKIKVANNGGLEVYELMIGNTRSVLHFHSDFTSVDAKRKLAVTSTAGDGAVVFDGSMEGYEGEILTRTSVDSKTGIPFAKTVAFGTTTLSGKFNLSTNSFLSTATATNVFTCADLTTDEAGGIKVKLARADDGTLSGGTVVFSGSVLVKGGPLPITTDYTPGDDEVISGRVTVLTFAPGVAHDWNDFVWMPANAIQKLRFVPSVVSSADGSESLVLDVVLPGPIVRQTVTDSNYAAIDSKGVYHPSSLTNATHWSDIDVPHTNAHYLCMNEKDVAMSLRTEVDAVGNKSLGFEPIDYTFPGESLTIVEKGTFVTVCSNLTIKSLRLLGGSTLLQGQYTRCFLNGKVSVLGDIEWRAYSGNRMTVNAEIEGNGSISFTGLTPTSTPQGMVFFSGLNTNYTGRLRVTMGETFEPSMTYRTNQTLIVTDGRALGGAGRAFDPKAITLERCGRLLAEADLTVSEPTRGLWINGLARIGVADGKTMTLTSPLAVYGSLHKTDPGTLVLGNTQPKFGESAVETTPDADAANRRFVLSEGNVKVVSAYALNGLDVVAEDAASMLLLDAETTDAEMAQYGVVNVLTPGTPFAGASGAKLKIAFTCEQAPAWIDRELAVCTVAADKADDIENALELVDYRSAKKLRCNGLRRESTVVGGVNCVTFKTTVTSQSGALLIVK